MISYRDQLRRIKCSTFQATLKRKLKIEDGEELLVVREDHDELKLGKSIFTLGVRVHRIAETPIGEFEAESEEMQRKLYG